jgi:hypothetical protein
MGGQERKKRAERMEEERGMCYIKDKGTSLVGALVSLQRDKGIGVLLVDQGTLQGCHL